MKYSTASLGRALIIRLEDGDVVHECIEEAARAEGIARAAVLLLGGADGGSRVVVGPEDGRAADIVPMERVLHDVHEMVGAGTLFPDGAGRPVLHLHASFGRDTAVTTGCIRNGVRTWVVGEAVVIELVGSTATRREDQSTGFELLDLRGAERCPTPARSDDGGPRESPSERDEGGARESPTLAYNPSESVSGACIRV